MTREEFLPFSRPTPGVREGQAAREAVESGWLTRGPRTVKFEEEFSRFLGVEDVLMVNSCTAALHLALLANGIGPGDEVITTPLTFSATANVVEHVGARLVLADVDPVTLQICAEQVALRMSPRTRAIIPVHYSGHPCEMNELMALAREEDCIIIEDAAHALPARYEGKMIGTIGDCTAFSFYATKNLTTGEGGALVCKDREVLENARTLSLHGMSRDAWRRYENGSSWFYEVTKPGFKYNMTDIQAAIGLEQLKRLGQFQARRRAIARRYLDELGRSEVWKVPSTKPNVVHAWHLFVVRLVTERLRVDRDEFIRRLSEMNIGTSVHFVPIHLHPYYREKYGWQPADYPEAMDAYERMVSLPLSPAMTDGEVGDVIAAMDSVGEVGRL